MSSPFIIAIDGPSASGKGTIARRLAQHFGFAHLDTGLLYRTTGLEALRLGDDPADPTISLQAARMVTALTVESAMKNPRTRNEEVSAAASKVAAVPAVRDWLFNFQRNFCEQPPGGKGAVLDGRDIGTVIAPKADVKIFVTASPEARAHRRFKELQSRGEKTTEAAVLADMKVRDARDTNRSIAPAVKAADAEEIDTTNMTADQAFAEALEIVQTKLKNSQ